MPRPRLKLTIPTRRSIASLVGAVSLGALLLPLAAAQANTSHAGWPVIARQDEQIARTAAGVTFTGHPGVHNELLGGNGSDTLTAGNIGDVLWGDHVPDSQSTSQVDTMIGGAGNDFFYASHGKNIISTGGGMNIVHAHYGYGSITCGSKSDIVYLSHKSRPGYKLIGCKHISYATVGF
ncbi:MAG TPA: hypothetical protein VG165_08525 [Solirubrobacteraceae bacterium]|jgi:Ca2+-binding RTX toxin-like protein|nr:hypothetical protein [Solirubrobacteraceae bacterium]